MKEREREREEKQRFYYFFVDGKKWRRNGGPKGGEMKGGMEVQVEACHAQAPLRQTEE